MIASAPSAFRLLRSLLPRMRWSSWALVSACLAGSAYAQVTEQVDVADNGAEANFGASLPPSDRVLSEDGRYILFRSGSFNLVQGDTNQSYDLFIRDRLLQTTERVSVSSSGAQANGSSGTFGYSMTPDARFVVLYSSASNLVTGDVNSAGDVFLRDRRNGSTELVSLDSSGSQANGRSEYPSISEDGRYVAFDSASTNLVPGDTNGKLDVFVRDRRTGQTERVSVASNGAQANGDCQGPSISADGRYVAFGSDASNLVAGDTNGTWDIFIHDRVTGTLELMSVSYAGTTANGLSSWPHVSSDGRYVGFDSYASNLVVNDTNGGKDSFVRDRVLGSTSLTSVNSLGIQANTSASGTNISLDGRFVIFASGATNLDPSGSTNLGAYVHDRISGQTERISLSTSGQVALDGIPYSVSADARFIAFLSSDPLLVSGDTNNAYDVYIRDRAASGFTSRCDPGVDNVLACPCNNPPSGPGRGCDNSSSSGGARLAASGVAYLSLDSLTFVATGERVGALSLLLQGDATIGGGTVFGQGVRCVGGSLKRLFAKHALAGSITAPDFGAGDPSVSSRAAALGAPIQAGHSYAYFVSYRDPIVPGGCAAASTFNCTQTGTLSYWP